MKRKSRQSTGGVHKVLNLTTLFQGENGTHKQKDQSLERHSELTEVRKLADENLKTVINMSKNLKENMNIINDKETIIKNQITSKAEKYNI